MLSLYTGGINFPLGENLEHQMSICYWVTKREKLIDKQQKIEINAIGLLNAYFSMHEINI